jgi:hypothetical protein
MVLRGRAMTTTTTTVIEDVRDAQRRLKATLGYAEALERLRGCRRAVARAARALATGDDRAASALEVWWRLERAQLAVVQRLRPTADEARRPTRDGDRAFAPSAATVLRLRAA